MRLLAQHELHSSISRFGLVLEAGFRGDPIQAQARPAQASLRQQFVEERILEPGAQPREAVLEQPRGARLAHLAAVTEDPHGELRRGHRVAQFVPEPGETVAISSPAIQLALESVPHQDLRRGVRKRRREALAFVRRQRGRVLEHYVEEEIRQQTPLNGGAPCAGHRSGHSRAWQPESPFEGLVRGIQQLGQQLRSRLVQREPRFGGGAQLTVPSVLQLAAFLDEKLAHAFHPSLRSARAVSRQVAPFPVRTQRMISRIAGRKGAGAIVPSTA